jgi:hypothetical protein
MMMEAIQSSETQALTRATRLNISDEGILLIMEGLRPEIRKKEAKMHSIASWMDVNREMTDANLIETIPEIKACRQ